MGENLENTTEDNQSEPIISFVLLEEPVWDKEGIQAALMEEWGIDAQEDESEENEEVENEEDDETDNPLLFSTDGMMAAITLIRAAIPEGEAEQNAATNYLWPEGVETAKLHKAHFLVVVFPQEESMLEAGKLHAKICATLLKMDQALGIDTAGTVLEPAFYCDVADMMKEDPEIFPLLDCVYFGLYRDEAGNCGYTYGLRTYGKEEIEVLSSSHTLEEVHDFLMDIASYVLMENVTLKDGETIGFSEEEKLPITSSKGVALEGDTLKIKY